MHLLETYALNCGAKINKPFIYEMFFPFPLDKFITFNSDEAEPIKSYDYWQDVINILKPTLDKKGIQIVQIGRQEDRRFSDVLCMNGQASPNQLAYIVKRSMAHFGPDGFLMHLASSYDIPIVSLHSAAYVGNSKPYFGSPSKQIHYSSYELAKQKPVYANDELPRTINLIKPETIAQSILNLLGIDETIAFETIFTGKKYSSLTIEESVPDSPEIRFNPEHQVEIRCDIDYDEASFVNQLGNYRKSIVVLDKEINIEILKRFKNNIAMLIFKIENDGQAAFIKKLVELGKSLALVSELPSEKIEELKVTYYEFGNINKIEAVSEEKINELKKDADKLFYRSSKITSRRGKYFYSEAASENGILMNNHLEYQKVIDTPSFWKNINFFTIIRPINA